MRAKQIRGIILLVGGVALAAVLLVNGHPVWSVTGAFVAGLGVQTLVEVASRSPVAREQDRLIRHLWSGAKRWPGEAVLPDPLTGKGISVERHLGLVSLIVAAPFPDHSDSGGPGGLGVVDDEGEPFTYDRYLLGFARRPIPAPLFRSTGVFDDTGRTSWRDSAAAVSLNDKTGAMEASTGEIAELCAQMDRALSSAAP